jgi:hypothetical protein
MKTKRPIDKDLAGALPALRRAAAAARRLSIDTETPFYVWEDGRVVDRNTQRQRGRSKGSRANGRRIGRGA